MHLVDYMSEHSLRSLLPRGTKTWQQGDKETTIDLVLASTELAEEMMRCAIHQKTMDQTTKQSRLSLMYQSQIDLLSKDCSSRMHLGRKSEPKWMPACNGSLGWQCSVADRPIHGSGH